MADEALKKEMRAELAKELFSDSFFLKVHEYLGGYNTQFAKDMRATEGITLLEFCLGLIPETVGDNHKRNLLFHVMVKLLDGKTIKPSSQLDVLPTVATEVQESFFKDFWAWVLS